MLTYAVAFKILMIGGHLVASIIEAGGKLGIKSKNEDTIGRVLKGLANILFDKNGKLLYLTFELCSAA